MAEDIKALIEKIQQEGVQAAQDKAREIETAAKLKAHELIERAKLDAEKIIAEAEEKISREKESAHVSLKQAARDTLLVLKKEISSTLDKVIAQEIHQALKPEELAKMIIALAKEPPVKDGVDIIVNLKKEDQQTLEKHFLDTLKHEIKKGIILKASDDITAGFMISFDSGKSYFDFSDKALAEYIGSCVRPGLKEILGD